MLGVTLSLCLAIPLLGQQTDSTANNSQVNSPIPSGLFSRWVDLQNAAASFRDKAFTPYTTTVEPWGNQVQYSGSMAWRFKFDSKGQYQLGFFAGTGRHFYSSWLNSGIGPQNFLGDFYLRQLYFVATPTHGLELQHGGFGFIRGDWTDITDFSNNGYLMGERVRVSRPDKFFFDEISGTAGALKDLDNPDVFDRFHHLDEINYVQAILVKKASEAVSLSGGYDSYDGTKLLHQAVKVNIRNKKKMPLADTILFEDYQRLNDNPAWGFGLTLQKTLFSRWLLVGGVTSVDRDFAPLNSEKLGRGRRYYIGSSYPIWHELSFVAFATKAFTLNFPLAYEKRFEMGITYDVQKALKRAHLF